jgi:hypothetical protein
MSGFEMYHLMRDGRKGSVVMRGNMLQIVAAIRKLGLLRQTDARHPLGVYYMSPMKDVYIIDFFLGRFP